MNVSEPPARFGRIDILDIARGVALLAMLVYHFTWDLGFFGYLSPDTAVTGGWRLFARGIAISFLVLVGVGLVLAHGQGIRWRPFLRRLAEVLAGAFAITVATLLFSPGSFVFFGILHQIAVGSLLGLLFLRSPFLATAIAATVVIVLPTQFETALTNPRWLAWIGFSAQEPLSNDFVPVFPWTGCILAGMAMAQFAGRFGLFERLAALNPSLRPARPLARLGRHSLAFYLIHQPVSIAIVAGLAQVFPPDQLARFQESCRQTCGAEAETGFCDRYCGCVEEKLAADTTLERLLANRLDDADNERVRATVEACSFDPAAR